MPLLVALASSLKRVMLDIHDADDSQLYRNMQLRRERVEQRIAVLAEALENSIFLPERDNINCALAGYRDGTIVYQKEYTLIWAGKVIEKVDDYATFAANREERLDRYFKNHGPGWLWYERGLMEHPAHAPRASRASELSRLICTTGLGQYNVRQSYQKRAGWVMRMPQATREYILVWLELADCNVAIPSTPLPGEVTAKWATDDAGQIYCQQEGPRLSVTSLLDSGATYPSLHPNDLDMLGINREFYAAQTIEQLNTANGVIHSYCYEMSVTVLDNDGKELVDETNAVWPYHGKYLGGLCPVLLAQGTQEHPGPEGFVGSARLSGILPFLACYYSSVPTRNKLFLGEDRNDVIGCMKFPGQRRWDISLPSTEPPGAQEWAIFGDPKIQFTHRKGQVIDRDRADIPHASYLVVNEGRPNEHRVDNWPKGDCDATRNARELAEDAAMFGPLSSPDM